MAAAAAVAAAAVTAVAANSAASKQASAARGAAGLSAEATAMTVAEQRRQFDQIRGDFAPYREIGEAALGEYAALWGIGRGGQIPRFAADVEDAPEFLTREVTENIPGEPDLVHGSIEDIQLQLGRPITKNQLIFTGYSEQDHDQGVPQYTYVGGGGGGGTRTFTEEYRNPALAGPKVSRSMEEARSRFMTTPGYEFRVEEGVRALDRSAAARGRLGSGGYGRDLTEFGQGIAAAEFENYANRLAGLASTGQASSAQTAAAGMQSSANIGNALMTGAAQQGNALMQAGTARASGYAGIANAANSGFQNFAYLQGLNNTQNQPQTQSYAPFGSTGGNQLWEGQ